MFRSNNTRRAKRAPSPLRPAAAPTLLTTPLPDISGAPPASHALEKSFATFFAAETANTLLTKPWLRLERGLRLQKLRAFAAAYPGLSPTEQTALNEFLVTANDARTLNTKSQITYEEGVIQSIKGLKVIRSGDLGAPPIFKIEASRQTKRV
jgi:hypothetical protein